MLIARLFNIYAAFLKFQQFPASQHLKLLAYLSAYVVVAGMPALKFPRSNAYISPSVKRSSRILLTQTSASMSQQREPRSPVYSSSASLTRCSTSDLATCVRPMASAMRPCAGISSNRILQPIRPLRFACSESGLRLSTIYGTKKCCGTNHRSSTQSSAAP